MTRTKAGRLGRGTRSYRRKRLSPHNWHACWTLPDEKKTLSDRQHQCPHCGATCGRDENAARVLLCWLKTRLTGIVGRTAYDSGSGQELSEVWSGGSVTAMKHETPAIAV